MAFQTKFIQTVMPQSEMKQKLESLVLGEWEFACHLKHSPTAFSHCANMDPTPIETEKPLWEKPQNSQEHFLQALHFPSEPFKVASSSLVLFQVDLCHYNTQTRTEWWKLVQQNIHTPDFTGAIFFILQHFISTTKILHCWKLKKKNLGSLHSKSQQKILKKT